MDRVSEVLFFAMSSLNFCYVLLLLRIVVIFLSCAARNEIQSEDGSPVKDVKCVPKRKRYCLLAFCPPVICAAVLAVLYGRSCSEVQRVNNGEWKQKLFLLNMCPKFP